MGNVAKKDSKRSDYPKKLNFMIAGTSSLVLAADRVGAEVRRPFQRGRHPPRVHRLRQRQRRLHSEQLGLRDPRDPDQCRKRSTGPAPFPQNIFSLLNRSQPPFPPT